MPIPTLIEDAMARRVLIATPTTLLALLHSVGYGWQQERVAESAQAISDLGRELHGRLAKLSAMIQTLGKRLNSTVTAYNDTVGSYERRVLPAARRFADHGAVASGAETRRRRPDHGVRSRRQAFPRRRSGCRARSMSRIVRAPCSRIPRCPGRSVICARPIYGRPTAASALSRKFAAPRPVRPRQRVGGGCGSRTSGLDANAGIEPARQVLALVRERVCRAPLLLNLQEGACRGRSRHGSRWLPPRPRPTAAIRPGSAGRRPGRSSSHVFTWAVACSNSSGVRPP